MKRLFATILISLALSMLLACVGVTDSADNILHSVTTDKTSPVTDESITLMAFTETTDLPGIGDKPSDNGMESVVTSTDEYHVMRQDVTTSAMTEQQKIENVSADNSEVTMEPYFEPVAGDSAQQHPDNVGGDLRTDIDIEEFASGGSFIDSPTTRSDVSEKAVVTTESASQDYTVFSKADETKVEENVATTAESLSEKPNENLINGEIGRNHGLTFGADLAQVNSILGKAGCAYGENVAGKSIASYVYIGDYSKLTVVQFYNGIMCGLMTFNEQLNVDVSGILFSMTSLGDSAVVKSLSNSGYKVTLYKESFSGNSIYAYYITNMFNYKFAAIADVSVQEQLCFHFTNAVRARNGCTVLLNSSQATTAARLHSKDMADNSYFNHDAPNGSSPSDRLDEQGIEYSVSGENICRNYDNAFDGADAIYNSASHREIILSKMLDSLGVGCAKSAAGFGYITQSFFSQ